MAVRNFVYLYRSMSHVDYLNIADAVLKYNCCICKVFTGYRKLWHGWRLWSCRRYFNSGNMKGHWSVNQLCKPCIFCISWYLHCSMIVNRRWHQFSTVFKVHLFCFLRIFGGLRADIKRKAKFYLSDFKDALHIQCLASFVFLYFACLTPIITFGGLLGDATDNNMVRRGCCLKVPCCCMNVVF